MYRAEKAMYSEDWIISKQYSCINGLSAWFEIARICETSEAELGYTEGAIGTSKERAEWIAKVLNNCGQEYG